MRGISLGFLTVGVVSVLIGMGWGIQMSASGDHMLAPAHAHLNLLGWVSMAIFAFYYHLVPGAARGWMPRIHFALAVAGLIAIVPGIVFAIRGTGETLAKAGSLLSLLSMLIFLLVVLRDGLGRHADGARSASPAV